MRVRSIAAGLMAVVVTGVFAEQALGAAARTGFTDALVAKVSLPTGVDPLPDGSLLVGSLTGEIRQISPAGVVRPQLVGDLRGQICTHRERGLQSIVVDPQYAVNRYVYVHYSFKAPGMDCAAVRRAGTSTIRVSRFTVRPDLTFDPFSELVLLDGATAPDAIHHGGGLEFAPDGTLLITIGDGGCHPQRPTDCGAPLNTSSRDMWMLNGKVLRLTRDGGIPADNPFAATGQRCNRGPVASSQRCAEIWAWGLRNPFKIAVDPAAAPQTRVHLNDVGDGVWEEIDVGVPGADYGWNLREGPCVRGSVTNCPVNDGYTKPLYAYTHGGTENCASIVGGAFVPVGAWNRVYNDNYLFGDYVCGKIFRIARQPDGSFFRESLVVNVTPIDLVMTTPPGETRPVLYYTSFGDGGGSLRRLAYTGPANRPPDAAVTADKTEGDLPLAVRLDASGSTDPDGDPLTYRWDFGDGSPPVDTAGPVTNHTFTQRGHATVRVTVTDANLATATAEIVIHPGLHSPVVSVVSPATTYKFSTNEQFDATVQVSDQEDGTLPDSAVSWEVLLRHAEHTHPYSTAQGHTAQFVGPPPEGFSAVGNSHLELYATATDSDGMSTTVKRSVLPLILPISLLANQDGILLTINGQRFTIGKRAYNINAWAGWPLVGQAQATKGFYRFKRWNDWVTANPRTIVPRSATQFNAYYSIL